MNGPASLHRVPAGALSRSGPARVVAEERLSSGGWSPLVLRPRVGLDAVAWAAGERTWLLDRMQEHGAVLLRDFRIDSAEVFSELVRALRPILLDYLERAAPRREVAHRVFTSTEYPADQSIPIHHEMSYSHNWPARLFFYCDVPSEDGGATPVADDRGVIADLDPELRSEFARKKITYVRNFGPYLDMSWQDAFQTDDPAVVEGYCAASGIEVEWCGEGLRTRQTGNAMTRHPVTGATLWFNHAHVFHWSAMPRDVREPLLTLVGDEGLPRNAYFGDGSPIPADYLDHVRATYERHTVRFPWQRGDVLLIDNFLVSHGRDPFTGPRRVLVAMADLHEDTTRPGGRP